MRYILPVVALAALCAGCVQPPPPPPSPDMISDLAASVAAGNGECRDYTTTVTVNGQQQALAGRACRQADGTWRFATTGAEQAFPEIGDLRSWPSGDNPSCTDYSATAIAGAQRQPVVGRACALANGSIRVTQGTPQQPALTTVDYPPPPPDYPYYYAGYYDPWFWGPPFVGVGGTFIFVAHDHHHHHGFGGHGSGHSGWSGHGGGHGGGGSHH
jgi:hypothetical protein